MALPKVNRKPRESIFLKPMKYLDISDGINKFALEAKEQTANWKLIVGVTATICGLGCGLLAYYLDILPTIQWFQDALIKTGVTHSQDAALGYILGFTGIIPTLIEMFIPTVAKEHKGVPAMVYIFFILFDLFTDRGFIFALCEDLPTFVKVFTIPMGLFMSTFAFEYMAAVCTGFGLRMVLEAAVAYRRFED
jgi:hypothetical protein